MLSQELCEDPQDHEKLVPRTQHGKVEILAALELKKLKGSVVWERVDCGKPGCHKCRNGKLHGPYSYLHYYWSGRVKKKYLPKSLGDLMSYSAEELENMLHNAEVNKNSSTRTCHKTETQPEVLMTTQPTRGKNEACTETLPGLEHQSLVMPTDFSPRENAVLRTLAIKSRTPISVRALTVNIVRDWIRRQPAASYNGGEIAQ